MMSTCLIWFGILYIFVSVSSAVASFYAWYDGDKKRQLALINETGMWSGFSAVFLALSEILRAVQ